MVSLDMNRSMTRAPLNNFNAFGSSSGIGFDVVFGCDCAFDLPSLIIVNELFTAIELYDSIFYFIQIRPCKYCIKFLEILQFFRGYLL